MRIATLNANGIRAAERKGLSAWLRASQIDICCLQEVRATVDEVPPSLFTDGSISLFSAVKKGYSGVGIWTAASLLSATQVCAGSNESFFDSEGRVLRADFGPLTIVSAYFPSGAASEQRQRAKLAFLEAFGQWISEIQKERPLLMVAADFNMCHTSKDIHDPHRLWGTPGFSPEESAWLTAWQEAGWVDAFRSLHPSSHGEYTWWSARGRAKERNAGWRIDGFWLSPALAPSLQRCGHEPEAGLSDHCPVWIELDESKFVTFTA